ncbi:acyltransferase family protein [Frondihabitans cladoniiphilus]|uniref:Acyltransferase family protein n=1 Tax=Frondihabitans cladoniiphilus TaxID=715785 RepID=A0ABP8W2K3_9MICO
MEGLRGLAVVAVVANHLTGAPTGGYLGVDVFFVLSGYLITNGLLVELGRTGSIDVMTFIVRRGRRLLPAAIAVVAATLAAAWLLWPVPRALGVTLDGIGAVTSAENWHLVAVGARYLEGGGNDSPLEHFWSLAVEEQFYAFWPVILLATGLVAARLRRSQRRACAAVVVVIGAASLVAAALLVSSNPSEAYFDSFARAWELCLGALVSALSPRVAIWTRGAHRRLATGGVLGMAGAFLLPLASAPGPLPAAALAMAALSAACVIAGAPGSDSVASRILEARPLRLLGRLSYSLYLVHFPVVVMTGAVLGQSVAQVALGATLTLILGAACYCLIENRFRMHGTAPATFPPATAPSRTVRSIRSSLLCGSGVVVLVIASSVAQNSGPRELTQTTAAAGRLGLDLSTASAGRPFASEAEAQAAVAAGLRSSTWAGMVPALDQAFESQLAPGLAAETGCLFDPLETTSPLRTCREGPSSATKTALVVGDSVAVSWIPAVAEALVPLGWRVIGFGFSGCPAIDTTVVKAGAAPSFTTACTEARRNTARFVETTKPDLVVTSSSERSLDALATGRRGSAARDEWREATRRTLDEFTAVAGRAVVLGAPPLGLRVQACATRLTTPRKCESRLSERSLRKAAAESGAVREIVADGRRAAYVDSAPWFCLDGACPIRVGEYLTRGDDSHLTNAMSESLGDALRPWLLAG